MKQSSFFSLNWKDVLNGFITAFLAAFFTQIYQCLEAQTLPTITQLKASGVMGLASGFAYLAKRLLSNDNGTFLTKNKPNDAK
jgi:hypothetical protein